MPFPSLHMATLFIHYLFGSRNFECDCGCRQNCSQDCPNSIPNITCTPPKIPPPSPTPTVPPTPPPPTPPPPPPPPCPCPHRHPPSRRKIIIVRIAVGVSLMATVTTPVINRAFFAPPMPNFALPGITVNSFDISTPNVIRANFQMRISSRNSDGLFRFYFDRLRIYVTYRDQQITFSTPLSPNPECHHQTDAWTANVCGIPVILEPNNAIALCQEQVTGCVKVTIWIVGRVRWKFWFFPSVKHRFSVKCSASISVGTQQPQIKVKKCRMKL